jgi:uncharacterized membrane protein
MYNVLDRSYERAGAQQERGFICTMQQNRSHFPDEARGALAVVVTLFMATSILPVLRGYWLVPFFSLAVMALLVLALEAHQKSQPLTERLALENGEARYSDSTGRLFALPSYWVRFETEQRSAFDIRLHLRNRNQRFEVGTSLNLEERLAVAPIIAEALATATAG